MEGDGNGWVRCARGHRHWGRFGAAGLLVVDRRGDEPLVLLQHRAAWTAEGGTWGVLGGARDSHETAVAAALREAAEEADLDAAAVRVGRELVADHGGWSYTTVIATLLRAVALRHQEESEELRWVPIGAVTDRHLHPGFAATWPAVRAAAG